MVDLYIVPNAVVRRWIESPRYVNGKGVQLYLYKRPVESGTREKMGQCIDLDSYRNRLDLLSESILKLLAPLPTS